MVADYAESATKSKQRETDAETGVERVNSIGERHGMSWDIKVHRIGWKLSKLESDE